TSEPDGGAEPVIVVRPGMTKSAPMPRSRAASVRALAGIRAASRANVVLHDLANARDSGTVPSWKRFSFGTSRPPITVVPGQSTLLRGVTSLARSAASAVAILNVDPGG